MAHSHSDAHTHTHTHAHSHAVPADPGRVFIVGIGLNIVFVAAEFAAGLILDSVALLSDAGHNLSDVAGLAISLLAFRLAQRRPTETYTYGHKRSTIIAALANACLLLVAVGMIIFESVGKLHAPQPVEGGAVAWVAGVGIVINGFTAWLFMRRGRGELNMHGAYLHMVADALVSVGVVVSGIVISRTGWYVVDPIVGIVIAVVIFFSTLRLLRESVRLSLDGVPAGIDRDAVVDAIRGADDNVADVHHLHIWALSTTENALTAHVAVHSTADITRLGRLIKERLRGAGIGHATLEFELSGECADGHCDEGPSCS